ncbi:hypothetical protein K440DRAFT_663910 [Wilcoxina mikolae CBS 423.85]|nr:hypothetical protein K440DRAFT_663910 [Wilcoxina mikolae CBS 423.85]
MQHRHDPHHFVVERIPAIHVHPNVEDTPDQFCCPHLHSPVHTHTVPKEFLERQGAMSAKDLAKTWDVGQTRDGEFVERVEFMSRAVKELGEISICIEERVDVPKVIPLDQIQEDRYRRAGVEGLERSGGSVEVHAVNPYKVGVCASCGVVGVRYKYCDDNVPGATGLQALIAGDGEKESGDGCRSLAG